MVRNLPREPIITCTEIHGPRVGRRAITVGDLTRDLPYTRPHQGIHHPVHVAHLWAERTLAAIGGDRPYW